MSYQDILRAQLAIDEGRRNQMYVDSNGVQTIGIGHNLRDDPISDAAIDQIFADDLLPIEGQCRQLFPGFDALSDARKAVLANMMFNLGPTRFSGFFGFISLVNSGLFDQAADDMLTTLWAKQVGDRAVRLALAMRDG